MTNKNVVIECLFINIINPGTGAGRLPNRALLIFSNVLHNIANTVYKINSYVQGCIMLNQCDDHNMVWLEIKWMMIHK